MDYQTVFDLAKEGYHDWWYAAYGLPFVALGAFLIRPRGARSPKRPWTNLLASWFLFGGAILWTLLVAASTYTTHQHLDAALASGQARVVAGPVEHFQGSIAAAHKPQTPESFTVQGQPFAYTDSSAIPGFHTTALNGGPIHEGLEVRITHVGGIIVKLEVRQ